MKLTPLCFLLPFSIFVFFPAACIHVSPDKSGFNLYDSVSLSCEDHVNGWRVKRSTKNGGVRTCLFGWGSVEPGSPCFIKNIYPSDVGLYWCESEDGVRTDIVNITITGNSTKPGNSSSDGEATDSSSSSTASCSLSVLRVLCHVVVGAPYLMSTVLLGLIYRDRQRIAAQTNTKRRRSLDVIMEIAV